MSRKLQNYIPVLAGLLTYPIAVDAFPISVKTVSGYISTALRRNHSSGSVRDSHPVPFFIAGSDTKTDAKVINYFQFHA